MSARTTGTGTTSAAGKRAPVKTGGRRGPRRWWILTGVLVVGAGTVGAVVGGAFDKGRDAARSSEAASATSLSTVTRRSLSEHTQVNGTLGYAGSYAVLGRARGTVTWLPRAGQVIREGQVLCRVDGQPLVLLYGASPAWRTLAAGASIEDVTGADVAQLNHALVTLGYVNEADVASTSDEFSWATRLGVEKLQAHLEEDQTGRLDLGRVVFLPTPARVTALQADLGGPANGPVLHATSTTPTVSVALDAGMQAEVKTGDRVAITLPDSSTTPGRVISVGKAATTAPPDASGPGGSTPTVPVHIRPTHLRTASGLDQAPVEVSITHRTVRHVLAVNVTALMARSGGGYAVEVVDGDGTHHVVPVTPGLFDDVAGMVQVSGAGLRAGQRVVVPGHE
ncbi:hypothetical protein [Nocardioides sp.]|jgi:hypothetical protein|uniref:efflux RND transporter periplasmic adaptor subunit n=1 Tax=Nocardioides sp. TaxID=35761 RepID=UPI002F3F86C7